MKAIIMAAGFASRFVPHCFEYPKTLARINGEQILLRLIRQLQEAKIKDITVITGYRRELILEALQGQAVNTIHNPDYLSKNNHSSIYHARHLMAGCLICVADTYYPENPFFDLRKQSFYCGYYEPAQTPEWYLDLDADDRIRSISIGGEAAYIIQGHAYLDQKLAQAISQDIVQHYNNPEIANFYWEHFLLDKLDDHPVYLEKFEKDMLLEFDDFEELRKIEPSYYEDSRSSVLEGIAKKLKTTSAQMKNFKPIYTGLEARGFSFTCQGLHYNYSCQSKELKEETNE